jgi:hypothetical protein
MPHDVISTCPVCAHELSVTRLRCRECGTTLEGDFSVGRFGRISREQLTLLESFLRSRGNLREMERELGISYPTVRGRVEALVRAIGLGGPGPAPTDGSEPADGEPAAGGKSEQPAVSAVLASERRRTLERLARREITADEAAAALRVLGGASDGAPTELSGAGQPTRSIGTPAAPAPATAPAPPAAPPPPVAPAAATSAASAPVDVPAGSD